MRPCAEARGGRCHNRHRGVAERTIASLGEPQRPSVRSAGGPSQGVTCPKAAVPARGAGSILVVRRVAGFAEFSISTSVLNVPTSSTIAASRDTGPIGKTPATSIVASRLSAIARLRSPSEQEPDHGNDEQQRQKMAAAAQTPSRSTIEVVSWRPDEEQNDDDDEQHGSVLINRLSPTVFERASQPGATIEPNGPGTARTCLARAPRADPGDGHRQLVLHPAVRPLDSAPH